MSIDGRTVTARRAQNLLQLLRACRLAVPAPCYHAERQRKLRCRLCLVEVDAREELQTACTTPVFDGMVVRTDSPRIEQARVANLESLLAVHHRPEACANCIWDGGCELHRLAERWGVCAPGARQRAIRARAGGGATACSTSTHRDNGG